MWIEFDNVNNARDLGGMPAADGRKVKPGRLLRGAGLDQVSERDVRLLRELPLRHIVDFRDAMECGRHPDREIPGAQYHSVPALPGLPGPPPKMDEIPDFDVAFRRLYGKMAESRESNEAYRTFFRILLDCREGAVYFHCAQGKDRTGIAAVLILSALGVPMNAIMADYCLSSSGLRAAMEDPDEMVDRRWPREVMEKLFFVYPQTMAVYLDSIVQRWGDLQTYLRAGIGLTEAEIAQLREDYLDN